MVCLNLHLTCILLITPKSDFDLILSNRDWSGGSISCLLPLCSRAETLFLICTVRSSFFFLHFVVFLITGFYPFFSPLYLPAHSVCQIMQESRLQESHRILFNDLLKIAKKILVDVLLVRSCRDFERTMRDSYKTYNYTVGCFSWMLHLGCELSLALLQVLCHCPVFFYCLQYVKWKGSPGRLYHVHRDVT